MITPTQEQKLGISFLSKHERILLADVVGYGKTLQALLASELPLLWVTKKTLIPQVCQDIQNILATTPVVVARNTELPAGSAPDVLVTNYETLVKRTDLLGKYKTLVVDECTYVKNRKAVRTKAVKAFADKATKVFLLTGTPVVNSPGDLWSLLNILYPKKYRSYWSFVQKYATVTKHPRFNFRQITGIRNQHLLAEELQDIALRRMVVEGLQEPIENLIHCPMGTVQDRMYQHMKKLSMAELSDGNIILADSVLAKMTRLRQLATSTRLLDLEHKECSSKLDVLEDLLEETTAYSKVLIFTMFRGVVNSLSHRLMHMQPATITGQVSMLQRGKEVQHFVEDDNCRALIATVKAAGEGLNLQAAKHIYFVDLPWTPPDLEQCIGRSNRRGQDEQIVVNTLVAADIDDHIARILKTKKDIITQMDTALELAKALKEEQA